MKYLLLVTLAIGLTSCSLQSTVIDIGRGTCLQEAEYNMTAVFIDFDRGVMVNVSKERRVELTQAARDECWWKEYDEKS